MQERNYSTPGNSVAERFGARLLLVNGLVLAAVAAMQLAFDLAGHFLNRGPTAAALHGLPDAIGYFEAHGLALILAVLMLVHRDAEGPGWNWAAAAIHLLLGGANLMFWPVFEVHGLVAVGLAATAAHAIFFLLEAGAALSRTPGFFAGPGAVFRVGALTTLLMGMVLHASSLAMGREAFVRDLFTPAVDMVFAVPMTVTGLSAIWLYRRAMFPALWRRWVYLAIAGYFTFSIALHLSTLATWDTSYVLAFPDWYPILFLALMSLLTVFVLQQRFRSRGASL